MTTYVTYDAEGTLTGCYRQELIEQHTACAIEVDEATADNWTGYRMNAARDGVEVLPPAEPVAFDLAALKQQLAAAVDTTIAAIYSRWLRFEAEYVAREAAARAFVAAGYAGDPGRWITGFATPAGMTNAAAADLIITQADGLRVALEGLGEQRMAKYGILSAADAGAAQAAHDAIIQQAMAIAAGL